MYMYMYTYTCTCIAQSIYVATSCTLSGLRVMCGCIHGSTLSVLRDMSAANAECTYIVMC